MTTHHDVRPVSTVSGASWMCAVHLSLVAAGLAGAAWAIKTMLLMAF